MEITKRRNGVVIEEVKTEEEWEKVKDLVFALEEEGGLEIFIGKSWCFIKIKDWSWSVQELYEVVREALE